MKIAVAGGTGFIGGHLVRWLLTQGYEVVIVSRQFSRAKWEEKPNVAVVTWDQLRTETSVAEGWEAIVNLSGETINQRWTAKAKDRILQSRLQVADQIADLVNRMKRKPKVVVNASGISIYGTSEKEVFDERSPERIVDFLSSVVKEWERTVDRIQVPRIVKVRAGIVLDKKEGAFPKMALPFKLGIGGKVGSGKQWLSWIHNDDMVRLLAFCIENDCVVGPINATAPHPITNEYFSQALAKSLHRPHLFPVPAMMMKALFGELSMLLLEGQRVLPKVALNHGFIFQYETIEQALSDLTD